MGGWEERGSFWKTGGGNGRAPDASLSEREKRDLSLFQAFRVKRGAWERRKEAHPTRVLGKPEPALSHPATPAQAKADGGRDEGGGGAAGRRRRAGAKKKKTTTTTGGNTKNEKKGNGEGPRAFRFLCIFARRLGHEFAKPGEGGTDLGEIWSRFPWRNAVGVGRGGVACFFRGRGELSKQNKATSGRPRKGGTARMPGARETRGTKGF